MGLPLWQGPKVDESWRHVKFNSWRLAEQWHLVHAERALVLTGLADIHHQHRYIEPPELDSGAKVVYPKTLLHWFLPSAYSNPAPYTYGDASRNSLVGPGRTNLDESLFKNFTIHEQMTLQFRFEAFNVFNHPQFSYPNQTVGNSQVGQITSIVGNARNLQASLRFQF